MHTSYAINSCPFGGVMEHKTFIPSLTSSSGKNANPSIIQQKNLNYHHDDKSLWVLESWIFLHVLWTRWKKHPRVAIWSTKHPFAAFIVEISKSVIMDNESTGCSINSHFSTIPLNNSWYVSSCLSLKKCINARHCDLNYYININKK